MGLCAGGWPVCNAAPDHDSGQMTICSAKNCIDKMKPICSTGLYLLREGMFYFLMVFSSNMVVILSNPARQQISNRLNCVYNALTLGLCLFFSHTFPNN